MLICAVDCYREDVKQQLFDLSEWMSAGTISGITRFYIREDKLTFAYCIDPELSRQPSKDYID